jgi:hypothetical protein
MVSMPAIRSRDAGRATFTTNVSTMSIPRPRQAAASVAHFEGEGRGAKSERTRVYCARRGWKEGSRPSIWSMCMR